MKPLDETPVDSAGGSKEGIDAAGWIEMLKRGRKEDRLRAASLLGESGANIENVVHALTEALADPDSEVRKAAADAMGSIARQAVVTTVELQQVKEELARTKQVLADVIAEKAEPEKKMAKLAAQLEAANKELESFTYSVSHDLRAPMRLIQGLSNALIEDYAARLDEPGKVYCRRIGTAANLMDTLIQDLLAYSRLSRTNLELEKVDLATVLADVKLQLESDLREKKVELAVTELLPTVRGHRATLVQVVGNLVSNAVKFVAPGVTPHVRIWADDKGEFVRLWVEDNGIGIAVEHQERIFRILERLHDAGTYPGRGTGLAIVQKGVERLKGRVGVESVPGQGSRFWLELEKAEPKE